MCSGITTEKGIEREDGDRGISGSKKDEDIRRKGIKRRKRVTVIKREKSQEDGKKRTKGKRGGMTITGKGAANLG